MRVADLLAAFRPQLRALTSHCASSTAGISWVHTSEHRDPSPFLRGQELLLTTGMNLDDRRSREQFVDRMHSASAAGVGYGTGLVHHEVSADLVRAAERSGLPLFEIPVALPFIEISRWVADRIYQTQYADLLARSAVQRALSRALLSGCGLQAMLDQLRRLVHSPVVVADITGHVLASSPPGTEPPGSTEELTARRYAAVEVGGQPSGHLHARCDTAVPDALRYAADLVGLELARRQAEMHGQRRLIGQIVEDVVHRAAPDAETGKRLRRHGLDPAGPWRILAIRLPGCSPERLRTVPWALGPVLGAPERYPFTALVGDDVVVLLPAGVDTAVDAEVAAADAERSLSHLSDAVTIGVSRPRTGIPGLRVGYLEALSAVRSGTGIRRLPRLSLSSLLVDNAELPLHDLASEALRPLLDYDRRNDGELCRTLAEYFANDCSAKETSRALFLHRNSLAHRLRTVEQLTGRDLARLEDRLELWIAIRALAGDVG